MKSPRIYSGKIKNLELINTTAWGMRMFVVHFSKGKAIYQIHQKRTLPFSVGDVINFSGEMNVNNIFVIHKLYAYNQKQIDELYGSYWERIMQEYVIEG